MRIATAWCLSVGFMVACGSSKPEVTLDADVVPVGCLEDSSKGAASAVPLAAGVKSVGMICPRGDRDYFLVTVAAGEDLLDVSFTYPQAVTKVVPRARLFAPDGVTQVPNAVAVDPASGDGKAAVATTFAVPAPGTYILEVGDATDANLDSVNTYVVQVAGAVDPDGHERNDTPATAKAADGKPGYFAYAGDVDVYAVTIATAGALLSLKVTNPAAASPIDYTVADAKGAILGTGTIPPSATVFDATAAAPAAGALFVSLTRKAPGLPSRAVDSSYAVALAEVKETDPNELPTRNDAPATATCLAGGAAPCAAVFAGTATTFKPQTGMVGSRGDRDYYVFQATAAPAVVAASATVGATAMTLALDIVVPIPSSPCTKDADCKVLAGSCTTNDDCEFSHQCIVPTAGACASETCRQCAGAGVCLPLPSGTSACGVTLYSIWDTDGGAKTAADGLNHVRTAMPVFTAGPVYVVVHDQKDDQYDPATPYTLEVSASPEPDPADATADPTKRNNFFNPYPIQATKLTPNRARAVDITAQITAGTPVTGYLSYQTDEDWFTFNHPCAGADCGLVFEWVQPGPSVARPVFFLRTDSLSLHESWTYRGAMPTTAPVTDVFGDGDCTECSFAAKKHEASGTTPYKYYLQVRDVGADDWDFTPSGLYQFRLKTLTPGCPASCSEAGAGTCGCFCKAQNQCPVGDAL
jgi:hypothetical protein